MFPPQNIPQGLRAKNICRGCPAAKQCLLDSLLYENVQRGIRGGLSEAARRKILNDPSPSTIEYELARSEAQLERRFGPPDLLNARAMRLADLELQDR